VARIDPAAANDRDPIRAPLGMDAVAVHVHAGRLILQRSGRVPGDRNRRLLAAARARGLAVDLVVGDTDIVTEALHGDRAERVAGIISQDAAAVDVHVVGGRYLDPAQ